MSRHVVRTTEWDRLEANGPAIQFLNPAHPKELKDKTKVLEAGRSPGYLCDRASLILPL